MPSAAFLFLGVDEEGGRSAAFAKPPSFGNYGEPWATASQGSQRAAHETGDRRTETGKNRMGKGKRKLNQKSDVRRGSNLLIKSC